ncbi:MAG: single-stranded-DNA-specific exonuclease RecJ, partial [Lachnospiraceae bacterium]|nr:single-stranded-DNA-specific exonuclease RecJ [Lachnospiraceae bacterium]
GMRALIDATGLKAGSISAYHIGFVLGPCINATGRLETADAALELFFSEDPEEARKRAGELVELNKSRRNLTEAYSNMAIKKAEEEYAGDRVLVVYIPECHESIAGIVAGRLRERFYKPSIVLTDDAEGNIKGSGRSTEAYSMYDELCRVRDLFTRFGGHKMAAGLSMNAGTAETLRIRLNELCTLTDDDLVEKMKIDIPLPVGYVDDALVEELETLEPFGIANPRPLFAQKDVPVRRIDLFGSERKVLKLKLEGTDAAGNTKVIDAVCFDNAAEAYEELKDSKTVSVLYQAGFNEYQGRRSVQLIIRDYMLT